MADNLVAGLSQDQIQITSSYTGTELIVFGAIENSNTDTPASLPDVVVVIRGPALDMTMRRKVRVAGVWINRDALTLYGMPGYYFVGSGRAIKDVAPEEIRERYQLDLADVEPTSTSTHTPSKAEPYRAAAIRSRTRDGLYEENPLAVEQLGASLFRVRVPIPASVPRGEYTANVYLLRDGMVIGAQATFLDVQQTGIERKIFTFAHQDALLYGLIAVLLAVTVGWLSSVLFRRQ
jgi:uncharacterized protein (TIGR02186 family)